MLLVVYEYAVSLHKNRFFILRLQEQCNRTSFLFFYSPIGAPIISRLFFFKLLSPFFAHICLCPFLSVSIRLGQGRH